MASYIRQFDRIMSFQIFDDFNLRSADQQQQILDKVTVVAISILAIGLLGASASKTILLLTPLAIILGSLYSFALLTDMSEIERFALNALRPHG